MVDSSARGFLMRSACVRAGLVAWAGLLCLPPFLHAHPVPRDNHDRNIAVELTAFAVRVHYRLEVDEWRVRRDLKEAEVASPETLSELHAAYRELWTAPLASNLLARLDGRSLAFHNRTSPSSGAGRAEGHFVYDFLFEAPWDATGGHDHTFSFQENNFAEDDTSRIDLSLSAGPGVLLHRVESPGPALIGRPPDSFQPGDRDRRRQARADFVLEQGRPALDEGSAGAPGGDTAEDTGEEPHPLLHLLLDTRRGLATLLLLAAGFGAAHALTPGHGKTLVAAYLVGERGTLWHALLLGLVTTLTHTGAVLGIAVLLRYFPGLVPAQVQSVLGLVGGLLLAGLGLWLLLRRLAGQADHVHLGPGAHHHHHPDPVPADIPPAVDEGAPPRVQVWHLVVLGMSGGIIPCWDAIALLFLPISAQRSWLALPLVLAFSAGLAGVLVALGMGVVLARRWTGGTWTDGPTAQRIVRLLPLASALLILGMGVWLCYDSVHSSQPPHSSARHKEGSPGAY